MARHTPVPVLLEAFPVPPSYIPNNPPPSGPPLSPLPPVPGPSRISSDTLLVLSSSSRRNSRISLGSRPDSIASNGSNSPANPRDSISSSLSSHSHSLHPRSASRTKSSPSAGRPSFAGSIEEESPSVSNLAVMSDGAAMSDAFATSLPPSPPATGDDSIASISMHDLPSAEDLDEDSIDAQRLHLQLRSTRSRSESHKKMLRTRSTSPGRAAAAAAPQGPTSYPFPAVPPMPSLEKVAAATSPRSSSPDISSLLSRTPRPRRRSSSRFSNPSRSVSRRPSEGVSEHSLGTRGRRSPSPFAAAYNVNGETEDAWEEGDFIEDYGTRISGRFSQALSETADQDQAERAIVKLERELEGGGSDSDSSLDLHTPLPHLMLRHGLLSSNSKLLGLPPVSPSLASMPPSPNPPTDNGRPGSVFSLVSNADSVMTKSGVMKDARDTPRRRVRHRDGRLLKGGIGLTTGLGWSDSEDEDAPSPLTRRISSLNLSRHSSASSLQSSSLRSSSYSYSTSRTSLHPLSRSYSNDAFNENDSDDFASNTFSGHYRSKTPSRGPAPPTSWGTSKFSPPSSSKSRSSGDKGKRLTRSASNGSALSLSIPEHDSAVSTRTPKSKPRRSAPEPTSSSSYNDDMVHTPSTASSLSIPLPITPQDDDDITPTPTLKMKKGKSMGALSMVDRDKLLPSLPNPRTGSIRRPAPTRHVTTPSATSTSTTSSGVPQRQTDSPRKRSNTMTSTTSSIGTSSSRRSSSPPPPMPTSRNSTHSTRRESAMPLPRQLKLQPHSYSSNSTAGQQAVPVPSISSAGASSTYFSQQRSILRSAPTTPMTANIPIHGSGVPMGVPGLPAPSTRPRLSDPTLTNSKSTSSMAPSSPMPKPRTGTGMVYRSSSRVGMSPMTTVNGLSSPGPGSRMRMPTPSRAPAPPPGRAIAF